MFIYLTSITVVEQTCLITTNIQPDLQHLQPNCACEKVATGTLINLVPLVLYYDNLKHTSGYNNHFTGLNITIPLTSS